MAKVRWRLFSARQRLLTATIVDCVLWDVERHLEKTCKVDLLHFEHPEIAYREKGVLALCVWRR